MAKRARRSRGQATKRRVVREGAVLGAESEFEFRSGAAPAVADVEERQAKVVRALTEPGRARRTMVKELDEMDRMLYPRILEAVDAGITYRRIEEITGISRAKVGRWIKERGAE